MRLWAVGSNPVGQLGTGLDGDSHILHACVANGGVPFPPDGAHVIDLVNNSTCTAALVGGSTPSVWVAGTWLGETRLYFRELQMHEIVASDTYEQYCAASTRPAQSLAHYAPKLIAATFEHIFLVLGTSDPALDDLVVCQGPNNSYGISGAHPYVDNDTPSSHLAAVREACASHDTETVGVLRVSAIAGGLRHVVLVTELCASGARHGDIARVLAWGSGRRGQIYPLNGRASASYPIPMLMWEGGDASGVRISLGRDYTAIIHENAGTKKIELYGADVTVGIDADVTTETLGTLTRRVIALPADDVLGVDTTWVSLCIKTRERILYGGNGTSGLRDGAEKARELGTNARLVAGSLHLLLHADDGRVFGWGWNEHGNLAREPCMVQDTPALVCTRAVAVWAGCATTFIATDE